MTYDNIKSYQKKTGFRPLFRRFKLIPLTSNFLVKRGLSIRNINAETLTLSESVFRDVARFNIDSAINCVDRVEFKSLVPT